ncbi:hypothetical protein ACFV06_27585 [Streptomyces sp. NPDC059618]|uniref:hypothetical protein n=1 Tax=Streptomyces sp. NPDC059618 TaxID=3346887 RepID=UPI003674DF39
MSNPQPGRDAPEAAYVSHVGNCRTCQRESGRCPQATRLWRFYQEWRNGNRPRSENGD